MTSFPADLILLAALVVTTASVALLNRRLKAVDRLNADYGKALAEASSALVCARDALDTFGRDGREVLVMLAGRIDTAHELIAEIDARKSPASLAPELSDR